MMSKIITLLLITTATVALGLASDLHKMPRSDIMDASMLTDDKEMSDFLNNNGGAVQMCTKMVPAVFKKVSDMINAILGLLKAIFALKKRDIDPVSEAYLEWRKEGLTLIKDLYDSRKKLSEMQQKCVEKYF